MSNKRGDEERKVINKHFINKQAISKPPYANTAVARILTLTEGCSDLSNIQVTESVIKSDL